VVGTPTTFCSIHPPLVFGSPLKAQIEPEFVVFVPTAYVRPETKAAELEHPEEYSGE
jgi:hypothetical protein